MVTVPLILYLVDLSRIGHTSYTFLIILSTMVSGITAPLLVTSMLLALVSSSPVPRRKASNSALSSSSTDLFSSLPHALFSLLLFYTPFFFKSFFFCSLFKGESQFLFFSSILFLLTFFCLQLFFFCLSP